MLNRSIRRDLVRQTQRESLDLGGRDDVIDDPVPFGPDGIDRLGREGHLFGYTQARGVQEGEHPTHVVRHTEFGRRDRERRRIGGDDHIAGEHRFRRPPQTPPSTIAMTGPGKFSISRTS